MIMVFLGVPSGVEVVYSEQQASEQLKVISEPASKAAQQEEEEEEDGIDDDMDIDAI